MGFWNKKDSDSPAPAVGKDTSNQSGLSGEEKNLQSAERLGEESYSNLRSAFSPGTFIQGKLSFESPVKVDGQLHGELFSTALVVIGEKGSIDVRAEVESLVVFGTVKGKIRARKRIEVLPGGDLNAEIDTPVLVIHEGGLMNGECRMS